MSFSMHWIHTQKENTEKKKLPRTRMNHRQGFEEWRARKKKCETAKSIYLSLSNAIHRFPFPLELTAFTVRSQCGIGHGFTRVAHNNILSIHCHYKVDTIFAIVFLRLNCVHQ